MTITIAYAGFESSSCKSFKTREEVNYMAILERLRTKPQKQVFDTTPRSLRGDGSVPGLVEPHGTGKRGRRSLLPVLLDRINSTPAGYPVVVKVGYSYASVYYHQKKLREHNVQTFVMSPNSQMHVNGHIVTNTNEFKYLLVGLGTNREIYTPMCVNIQAV